MKILEEKLNFLFLENDYLSNPERLIELKENYKSIGYSATEVKLHLNKIYSIPFYLMITSILGALLMLKFKIIKSKFLG